MNQKLKKVLRRKVVNKEHTINRGGWTSSHGMSWNA